MLDDMNYLIEIYVEWELTQLYNVHQSLAMLHVKTVKKIMQIGRH